jgi:hypothetical protein
MAGVKKSVSCWELFKKLNINPFPKEFLLSLLSLIVEDMEKFRTNTDVHTTRLKYDLHIPNAKLTSCQKDAHCAGIKLFITLPCNIKSSYHGIKVFKAALKD